jgi:hypothetical protein
MLGIGVALVASLANYHVLMSIHPSLWRNLVSRADRAGWDLKADGAVDRSAT